MNRDELLAVIAKAKQENATELDLRHEKNIYELLFKIWHLTALQKLILLANQLTHIPAEIAQLTNLQELYLSYNQLTYLPAEITQLAALQKLHLSNNQFNNFPAEITQLANLQHLVLSYNKFIYIPAEIAQLTALQILDLSHNKLTHLPAEIAQLTNLQYLDLFNNKLTNLPAEIAHLKNLWLLDLRANPIKNLPNMPLVKQGDGIYVPAHAPQLPNELLQRNNWDIYFYLKNILEQENRPLNEAKLILVGEGAVGKTCLVNQLVYGSYNDKELKTEGINKQLWRLPLGETQDRFGEILKDIIRVNVWDFGGQEIMHATHQFFLTKRSIYLIVLDARRGEQESRLEYWLKLVHSFGGDSPVIIVINKSDEHLLDVNERFLKAKYPNIQAFCAISCKTAFNIDNLKTIISEQIAGLKEVKDPLPKTWFELKGALETLSDNYIDYTHYQQLCEQYQITEKSSQKTLLSLLHDLGIILNFQDDDRFDRLKETNVLKPEWVTDAVYKILNNNALFHSKGQLKLTDLSTILNTDNYPTRKEHQFIIDMMQKFELCFKFENENTFLIPDLLQKQEPDLNWHEAQCLAFQYHYDVLPNSVISRFIVRMNTYISKQTYWRTGVVLNYDNHNKALIRADSEDKKIYIYVNGNEATRREFLAVIRRDFEHIHSTIKGLKIAEKIPYKSALLDYQHLLKLEKLDEQYIIPEGLEEKVLIKELLAGYKDKKIEHEKMIMNIESAIFINGGNAIMSNNKTGNIGNNAVVQQARDNATQTVNPTPSEEKKSIFDSKTFLAFIALIGIIVIFLAIIYSMTELCSNKILSDKSCRILYQEIIVRVPFIGANNNENNGNSK